MTEFLITLVVFIQKVYTLLGSTRLTASPSLLSREIRHLRETMFGRQTDYSPIKSYYNQKMLRYADTVREDVRQAPDPLLRAMQYSICGNYIDFSVPQGVEEDKLEEVLGTAPAIRVDAGKLSAIRQSLAEARTLVFLLDNCGEIVLDKIFLEEIRREYPQIQITAVVRGGETVNDVTEEDAGEVAMSETAEVLSNGDDIAGNDLERVSQETRDRLLSADVIFSKGQGNFETLNGCGLNAFYFFLCKCGLFADVFKVPLNTGMVVHDSET